MTHPVLPGTPAALFEHLMLEERIRGRAELAAELDVTVTTLQRLYLGTQPLHPKHILRIHEWFGMEVWKIRELSGQHTDPAKRKAGLQAGSVTQLLRKRDGIT